jgi:hypothetical protein
MIGRDGAGGATREREREAGTPTAALGRRARARAKAAAVRSVSRGESRRSKCTTPVREGSR